MLAKSKNLCIIMGKILGPCVYVKVLEIQNFKSFFDFIIVLTKSFHHHNTDFQGWYLIIQYQIDRVRSIEGFTLDKIAILSHKFEWI